MRIELFGGLTVREGGFAVDRFPTQRARVLLAYLAYYREVSHPRGVVAEMLWPGASPDAIRLRLNQTVAEVRRALKSFGDPIRSDRLTIGLGSSVETDIGEFASLISQGRLDQAASLAKLELLPGFYEDWALQAVEQTSESLFKALASLADDAISGERWEDALGYARRAASIDAYDEPMQQRLLKSLVNTGRMAEAQKKFEGFDGTLRSHFAVGASTQTRSLLGSSPLANKARPATVDSEAAYPTRPAGRAIEDVLRYYIDSNNPEQAMTFACSLVSYWNYRGEMHLGYAHLRETFAMRDSSLASPAAKARALVALGLTATSMGKFHEGEAALRHALNIAQSFRYESIVAEAQRAQGQICLRQAKFVDSMERFQKSLSHSQAASDKSATADCWTGIGEAHRFLGQLTEAETAHRTALELRTQIGRIDRAAHSTLNLGIVVSRLGRHSEALPQLQSALEVLRKHGSKAVVADTLMEIAGVRACLRDAEMAACLLSGVASLRNKTSAPIPTADRPDYVRFLSSARDQIDRVTFGKQWEIGQTLPLDDLIELALVVL